MLFEGTQELKYPCGLVHLLARTQRAGLVFAHNDMLQRPVIDLRNIFYPHFPPIDKL